MRRKGDKVFDSIKAGDRVDSIVVIDEDVEEQGVVDGLKLLANEEFNKECDDCGHERKVSKKRKASRKLHSPKYVLYPICDLIVMLMPFFFFFSCSLELFSLFHTGFGDSIYLSRTMSQINKP